MKITILFATIEGQTGKIAHFINDRLQAQGHDVTLVDLSSEDDDAGDSLDADRFILAASVHERRHPKPFEVTLAARRADLSAKPSLFLSVSLNAAFPEGQEEARDYVTEMCMRTGFTPTEDMLVAGAVRHSRYDYFASQVVKHVVLRDQSADAGDEQEFTDWDAVAARVLAFAAGE